jgi:hypothetical protein
MGEIVSAINKFPDFFIRMEDDVEFVEFERWLLKTWN